MSSILYAMNFIVKLLILLAVLIASLGSYAQAAEKKTLNLGLVPSAQQSNTLQPATVRASNTTQNADPPADLKDPNVRVFQGGGAEDLLKVTKPLDNGPDDTTREGDQRQNVENQRLQNQLPNGLSNAPSRGSAPLNSMGR